MQEKKGIDWSSLWRVEDWWACWIGWLILILAWVGVVPNTIKYGTWSAAADIFPKGMDTLWMGIINLLFILVITIIGCALMKRNLRLYVPGFIAIFLLVVLAEVIAHQTQIKYWGIPYVLWALGFGLIISNVFRVPKWLKASVMTEYFIKIGLVCMGATIMFQVVMKAGGVGMGQALLVVGAVWFFTYWLCRRFGLTERFSSIIATGNSICGVSASIAAGGAVKGDPKEVSYIIAWLMVCAVVLIIVMPPIARAIGLPTNMAGAWVGGVIDNTGSVVAAGEVIGTKAALEAAAMVKMAQNVLIGFAAFFLAIWATMSLERKPGAKRPSYMEIWYRFPKFIIGFVVASLIITFAVVPTLGADGAAVASGLCKSYRSLFFAMAFVSIGLETNFKELVTVGGGRPAAAYWLAQLFNAFWTLGVVYVLWSGWLFTPPILPD
ncbi:MAG TPA: putative sulfate exporter family transporter [Dehalococcoidales bacterium]|nr:putative sulfate exporter family transporter [Dehalococcoidales bacterium]